MKIRTYSDLLQYNTFGQRLKYLDLHGVVGDATFGFDRYLNQYLYQRSRQWKEARQKVILRDNGCDLGIDGYELNSRDIIVHHMNPITKDDIIHGNSDIFNPQYLISVSRRTHNAIHYGNTSFIADNLFQRLPNDTNLWQRRSNK